MQNTPQDMIYKEKCPLEDQQTPGYHISDIKRIVVGILMGNNFILFKF